MAVTISRYNHTLTLFLNQQVDLENLFVMLLDNDATFVATHTSIDDVAGQDSDGTRINEVFGNGWDLGGEQLLYPLFTAVVADGDAIANDSLLDATDITVTATGGAIGPAYKAAIYDKTSEKVLFFYDLGEDQTAGQDTDFKFLFPNGIMRVRDYP
jgi:hypothetical protein